MTSEPGLRERKKLATRQALSRAALRLAASGGLEAVTPEAVAEAAGVSVRTFRNYFAGREEALVDELNRRALALVDAVAGRPADEPVWESLPRVLPDIVREVVRDRQEAVTLLDLARTNPAVLGQHLLVFETVHRGLTAVIAARTGTDPLRDLAPRLAAGAVVVAMKTSIDLWSEGHCGRDLDEIVREALAALRAGLPLDRTG